MWQPCQDPFVRVCVGEFVCAHARACVGQGKARDDRTVIILSLLIKQIHVSVEGFKNSLE